MKILQVHNRYRNRGGEESVVDATANALQQKGVEVILAEKGPGDLPPGLRGKIRASLSGIYSFTAAREMRALLQREKPDCVHVHNLYPLFSPSILGECQRAGIPVVMTCHNYRPMCPVAVQFHAGKICERCHGHREYWCFLKNCRENRLESLAYAARHYVAEQFGWLRKHISRFVAISAFLKQQLAAAGLPEDRIDVIPNPVALPAAQTPGSGAYAGFAGRISEEKGLDVLIEAARRTPEIPVRIAGEGPLRARLASQAPPNVTFMGFLQGEALAAFYRDARFLIAPSAWQETFGLVVVEAMARGLPVIASGIGGLAEIVVDGETGLLAQPGDPGDLAHAMTRLWEDAGLCRAMSEAGRIRAAREYSLDRYSTRLMDTYQRAGA